MSKRNLVILIGITIISCTSLFRSWQFQHREDMIEKQTLVGEELLAVDQPEAAASAFQKALALDTDNKSVRSRLGRAYYKAGRYQDAIETYRDIERKSSLYDNDSLYMGNALWRTGQHTEAHKYWQSILERSNGSWALEAAQQIEKHRLR